MDAAQRRVHSPEGNDRNVALVMTTRDDAAMASEWVAASGARARPAGRESRRNGGLDRTRSNGRP